jgi:hypothetical protein
MMLSSKLTAAKLGELHDRLCRSLAQKRRLCIDPQPSIPFCPDAMAAGSGRSWSKLERARSVQMFPMWSFAFVGRIRCGARPMNCGARPSKEACEGSRMKLSSKKPKLNQDTFIHGIRGKVLRSLSFSNELECRYISLEFEDKTELTISLDTRVTGKLELFDWKTGDRKLISKLGLVPDDTPA